VILVILARRDVILSEAKNLLKGMRETLHFVQGDTIKHFFKNRLAAAL